MTDVVDKKTRSWMMSGIRGKDTKPELVIRDALSSLGYKYRIHDTSLPGKPDLVFPDYHAVIFTHGCFWHGHGCHLFKWPSTRPEFWENKIYRNISVDKRNYRQLKKDGWYILTIWECALKGKARIPLETIINRTVNWLEYEERAKTIRGKRV